MPTSDQRIQDVLGKALPEDAKGKIPDIMSLLTQYDLTSDSALQNVQQNLGMLGIPKEAISSIMGVAKERGTEQKAAAAEDAKKYDFAETPQSIADQAAASGMPDFSGIDFSKFDPSKMGPQATPEPASAPSPEPLSEAEQRDARFGNDMAWLDETFQQKGPSREESEARFGKTADEHAAARQRQGANELFDLYEKGGLGAQERAARAKARSETEGMLRGQREADMQNLAERGMSGSGAEMAALLGGNQAAGERLSQADLQTSADAEQRALNALMGGTEIETGLQKSADDYLQNNLKMLGDIEAQNVQGRRTAYQQTMAQRNAYDMNKLGLQVGAAGTTASRDALENQAGWGAGRDVAKTDVGAVNQGQAGYNANQTGTYQAGGQRLDAAGNKVTDLTGRDKEAYAAGIDDLYQTGKQVVSYGGAKP